MLANVLCAASLQQILEENTLAGGLPPGLGEPLRFQSIIGRLLEGHATAVSVCVRKFSLSQLLYSTGYRARNLAAFSRVPRRSAILQ